MDPFPKTLKDMCRVLAGWKNDNKHNRFSDANDGAAFATTDGPGKKGNGRNKKVMCYKCQKQGHDANECDEDVDEEDDNTTKKTSNKKGSNFMNHGQSKKVENNDNEGDTTEEDAESSDNDYKSTFLQHDVVCSIQDKAAIPESWTTQHPIKL